MPDVTVTPTLTISATAPAAPAAGDLWWNSAIGIFFVYYDDGTSVQWVTTQPVKYINVAAMEGPAGGDLTGYYPDPMIMDAVALEYPVLRNPMPLNDYSERLASTKWTQDMFASFGLLGQITSGPGILLTPDPMAGDSTIALRAIDPVIPAGNYGAANATASFAVDVYGRITSAVNVPIPPINSPAFSGTPTAPTPALATDNFQIANTAWVRDLFDASIPGIYAPLNSPVFTGDPRAPSPAFSDDDTSIATTEWVRNLLAFTPGSVLISGADGFPSSDPTQLFWDNPNDRLGIGVAVPLAKLHLKQTWNSAPTAFKGLLIDITATAQTDPSYPLQVLVGGSNMMAVDRFGTLLINAGGFFGGNMNILTGSGLTAGGVMAQFVTTQPNFGWAAGSGAPTLAANRGTLYLRSDGPPGPYVNIDGATNWVPIGGSVTVSDTAPLTPLDGQLWWNSTLGNLFIYYNDGSTSQWVPAAPAANGSGVQAAFNVRMTAVDSVGAGANIPLFRTASTPVKDHDPNGVWDLVNNRFTAPTTGRYAFTCHIYASCSAPSLVGLIVRHSTAAGVVIRDYMQAQVVDVTPYGSDFVISTELQMSAGERVSFHIGNNSGTLTMAPTSSSVGGLLGAALCFAFGHMVT